MKGKWKAVLSCLIVAILCSIVVFATNGTRTVELLYSDIKVKLNGNEITPRDANGNVVEPFIIDGTTYLPVRGVASALGLDVDWDGNTNTVILGKSGADSSKTEFGIGETWTVDGLWSFTVNSVKEVTERNQFSDKNPAAVYLIDYTYENLGYTSDILDGLYINLSMGQIVDSTGTMGYMYPGNITHNPQATPVGAKCNAQACVGVDNAGNFKITVSEYGHSYSDKYTATFNLNVN